MPDEPKELEGIEPKDVEAVTEKLKEWIPTLPEQEQLVMGWVLTRAAAADESAVEEYAKNAEGGVPVSSLMAEAAGLGDVGGYMLPGADVSGTQPAIRPIGPIKIWTFRW